MNKRSSVRIKWNKEAKKLVGRKIVAARYMTMDEVEKLGWDRCPIILMLDDDTILFPASDDEGNDAGSLCMNKDGEDCGFPVLR